MFNDVYLEMGKLWRHLSIRVNKMGRRHPGRILAVPWRFSALTFWVVWMEVPHPLWVNEIH